MTTQARIPPSRQREKPRGNFRWIGQSMKRVEDPRLLAGQGRYIDDVVLPNMLHAAALRSPHAHARIKSIDVGRAKALPGVVAVMTGADVAKVTGPLPCFANPPVEQRCVALDRVRHVGEPVVIVAAESRYIAEDALELIDVEYEPLPAMVDPEAAIKATGDAVLHPERGPSNVALHRNFSFGPVADDFANAGVVIRRRLRWPRSGAQPLETCGAVAQFDRGAGKFTVHVNSSMYNYVGWLIGATLGVPAHKLNIIPTLAGGSFGSKLFLHKVPVIAATLARATGRPVKYLEDRIDNITACDNHGSDRIYDAELALDADRRMTGLRCKVIDDYGAYFQFGIGHHGNALSQITGPYKIRSVEVDITAVLDQQMPAGRLSRLRLRGRELRGRAPGRCRGRPARARSGRVPARQLHPARGLSVLHPDRQPLRQRQLSGRARQGAGDCSTTRAGARSRRRRGARAATSASASPPARSGACSARPSSGC